jgi:hypothetical protein
MAARGQEKACGVAAGAGVGVGAGLLAVGVLSLELQAARQAADSTARARARFINRPPWKSADNIHRIHILESGSHGIKSFILNSLLILNGSVGQGEQLS